MFQELMPLLAQRMLLLTLSRVDSETICVNVIPQRLKNTTEENGASTTPLSLTGTPEELDRQLPQQLTEFVGAHLHLSSTLRTAKEEMEAAAKSAKEAARKSTAKTSSAADKGSDTTNRNQPDSAAAKNSREPSAKPEVPQPEIPSTGSLFASTGD
jgi:PRTRC genetic system protein E